MVLFEGLAQQLRRGIHGNETLWGDGLPNFPARPVIGDNRFLNLAFYESYFSNYIEGTEFTPEDAHDIALDERVVAGQPRRGTTFGRSIRSMPRPRCFCERTAPLMSFWRT